MSIGNDSLNPVSSTIEGKGSPFGHTVQSGSFLEPANRPRKLWTTRRDHDVSFSKFFGVFLELGGGVEVWGDVTYEATAKL